MEVNTIAYVFAAKKPELRRLVVKYGLPPAKNDSDLWKKTNYLVAKFKKEMLKDIAYIHPDRELVLWSIEKPVVAKEKSEEKTEDKIEPKEKEEFSNCNGNPNCNCGIGVGKKPCGCGCSDKAVEVKSNAEGLTNTLKNNMPLVVVGSLLLVGGLILFNRQA
jgi:hypothetical protein